MSARAIARIKEAKRTRATHLDLRDLGLTKLPKGLFELTWLEGLILKDNKDLKNLNPLSNLISLQLLDVSSTQVNDLSPLSNLTALQQLYINKTKIDSELGKQFGLIKKNALSPLSNLISLQLLDVSSTQVSDLSPLSGLTHLQVLKVSSTQVSDLSPLSSLTQLQLLYVANTQISNLSPLSALTQLRLLHVANTQVNDLSPLSGLTHLQVLNVSSTQVSDLTPLKSIIKKEVKVKWENFTFENKNKIGIYIQNCPLINPPKEIVKQGNEAILNYWQQLEEQGGAEDINESKLIIVGEGGTGKTTLFEKLKDPSHDPLINPTPETHGINILEGLALKDGFRANLWDFGGQELQYMTHQFFLTPRALYVLMMDARKESPNLSYWFKIISLLGRESDGEKAQVLLVFNKRKGGTGVPQYEDLLAHYKEDFDYEFIEVDFAENNFRWEHLKNCIEERLNNLAISLPKQWKPIREALRAEALTHPRISMERFSEICSLHQVAEEESQLLGSRTLHKLGQILHFDEIGLRNHLILSPKWAVEAVYCFLGNESIEQKAGRFTENDFIEILNQKGYKRADADLILQIMTRNHFDICYKSKDGNYVAAQLLPDNRPTQFKWHPEATDGGALQFRYQYPTMPKGLISRLIVRLSERIEQIDGVEVVWKKGAILRITKDGQTCRVLLQEDDAESKTSLRQIKIEVMGEPSYRKFALQKVRDEVEELHKKWFRNIHADEIVPCCCKKCRISNVPETYVLKDLLKLLVHSLSKQCLTGNNVRINHLLEGIYNKDEIGELALQALDNIPQKQQMPDIHVHINNNPNFQQSVQVHNDFSALNNILQQLSEDTQAALKTFVETLPEPEDEDDKQTYGKQIIKWLNKNAEGIVGNVAASVYYDGLKFLFGI